MAEDTKSPLPEDIKQGLISLATSSKTPPKTVLAEFKEIVENNADVQAIEVKEHKIRLAYALLLNRYTSTGGAKQMYLKPLSIPRARLTNQKPPKYVGDIYATIKLIDKDEQENIVKGELQFAAGTLWENAAEAMQKLSADKVYKTSLRATETKHGIELGGNDATFIEVEDDSFLTNKELFDKDIKPNLHDLQMTIGDIDISNSDNVNDIKVIKAMVIDAAEGETAKKVEFGRYTITDDSMIGREEGGPGNVSIWVHPKEVVYGTGSTLYFIGTAAYDSKAELTRFNCQFIIPGEVALKRVIKPKPVAGKEEISMDSLDAELDTEHSKVSESLGDDDFAL